MAELIFNDQLTVLEQAQLLGPDGGILTIAEILNEENEILSTSVTKQANGVRGHVTARRTSLPTIYPRKINQGATTKYPTTEQIQDEIMLLESFPEIDEQLIDPYPEPMKARASQLVSYVEAFAQAFTENLIYGNRGDIGEINGWSTVYNALAMTNVTGAGGTGSDTTSLFMAEWHPMRLALLYPKGSKTVGLFNKDLKKDIAYDTDGNPFMAYKNQLKWEFGWTNPDTRSLQRMANIETTGTTSNLISNTVVQYLVQMRGKLVKRGKGKVKIYGNRTVLSQFDIWAMDKSNGFYYQENISGGPMLVFQGIPIHLVEQILDTEAAIS